MKQGCRVLSAQITLETAVNTTHNNYKADNEGERYSPYIALDEMLSISVTRISLPSAIFFLCFEACYAVNAEVPIPLAFSLPQTSTDRPPRK